MLEKKEKKTFIKNKEIHNNFDQIINKFLLTRDKFKPQLHVKQPGFT